MTKTQPTHTPGPWNVSVNFPDGKTPTYYVAQDAQPGVVCLWPVASSGIASKADANIIAAAPDMLAALERASAITSRRWRSLPPDSEEKQAHQQIVAAIRKARGE